MSKSVEEIKAEVTNNFPMDEILASAEAFTQIAEENAPQFLSCAERLSNIFLPYLLRAMKEGAVSGYEAVADGIIVATKKLEEAGFSKEQAIKLLTSAR